MFVSSCREPTRGLVARDHTPDSVCKEPAMTIDLLPTIAGLIGETKLHRLTRSGLGKSVLTLVYRRRGRNLPRGLLLLLRKPVASGQQEKMEASFPPWLPNDG